MKAKSERLWRARHVLGISTFHPCCDRRGETLHPLHQVSKEPSRAECLASVLKLGIRKCERHRVAKKGTCFSYRLLRRKQHFHQDGGILPSNTDWKGDVIPRWVDRCHGRHRVSVGKEAFPGASSSQRAKPTYPRKNTICPQTQLRCAVLNYTWPTGRKTFSTLTTTRPSRLPLAQFQSNPADDRGWAEGGEEGRRKESCGETEEKRRSYAWPPTLTHIRGISSPRARGDFKWDKSWVCYWAMTEWDSSCDKETEGVLFIWEWPAHKIRSKSGKEMAHRITVRESGEEKSGDFRFQLNTWRPYKGPGYRDLTAYFSPVWLLQLWFQSNGSSGFHGGSRQVSAQCFMAQTPARVQSTGATVWTGKCHVRGTWLDQSGGGGVWLLTSGSLVRAPPWV